MTTPPRPPKKPQAVAISVFYLVLAGFPLLLWHVAGNPLAATADYTSADQIHLVWNTLLADPAEDAPAFAQAAVDLLWIAWIPFALAATLLLSATVLRVPRAAIPRILLRLTPVALIQGTALGAVAVAQAQTGALHAAAFQHHELHQNRNHKQDEPRNGQGRTEHDRVAAAIEHIDPPRRPASPDARTVRPGDTLWGIAEQEYGRGQDWPAIYNANQDHIQPDGKELINPARIEPDWNLAIPTQTGTATQSRTTGRAPEATAAPGATPSGDPTNAPATPAVTGHVTPEAPTPAVGNHGPFTPAGNGPTAPAAPPAPHGADHAPPFPTGPRTNAPWTTGLELPNGGYLGVTLLMAVTGSLVALRRRTHSAGHTTHLPAPAESLAIIAGRAEMASIGEWDPELETDATPPPLLRPRPEHLIFGTAPTGTNEAVLDPARHPLTAYCGPGAYEAAAALALSALSSEPPHRLITTNALARKLLGIDTDPAKPDWLTLTADTPAALRSAADQADASRKPTTLVIADAETARTFQITAALAADRERNRLAVLLLGDVKHLAPLNPTSIEIDHNGQPRASTGPQATAFHAARFHILPPTTASDLYRVLHHHISRSAPHIPSHTHNEHHPQSAGQQPEPDPSDDEHHPTQTPHAANAPANTSEQPSATGVPSPVFGPVPMPPPATATSDSPIILRVLGPLTFENTTGQTRPGPVGRSAQLLTYLALHPRGRTLQQITAAIWNSTNPSGANSTLVRVRKDLHHIIAELASELSNDGQELQPIILEQHGTYHFNHRLITTDHASFERLETAARREKDPARRAELAAQAAAHLRGELAEGTSEKGQDWLSESRADLDDRGCALLHIAEAQQPTPPRAALRPDSGLQTV